MYITWVNSVYIDAVKDFYTVSLNHKNIMYDKVVNFYKNTLKIILIMVCD